MDSQKKDLIIDFVKKINDLWLQNDTRELNNYLSNDVVFASPGFDKYLKGKDLCINSYKEFISQAVIDNFQSTQFNVDHFDDIAIVTYHFLIQYRMNGKNYNDEGYEIMAFRKQENQWLLIWRTQMPMNS